MENGNSLVPSFHSPHQDRFLPIVHRSGKPWLLGGIFTFLNAAILMRSHLQGGINKDILCLGTSHLVCRLQMGIFRLNCYTIHEATEQTAQLISQLSAVFSALCIMSFWFILLINEFLYLKVDTFNTWGPATPRDVNMQGLQWMEYF